MSGVGCNVLLVEDDEDFAFITSAQLTSAGHTVIAVPAVHEALARLSTGHGDFDVVLLDLGLPDISGLDGLRATSDSSGTPVVLYTADARASLRRAAEELGAAAVLVKGEITPELLDRTVRRVARTARPRLRPPFTDADTFVAHDGLEPSIRDACDLLARITGLDRWAFVRPVASVDVVLVRLGPGDELEAGAQVEWLTTLPTAAQTAAGEPLDAGTVARTPDGDVEIHAGVAARIELDPGISGALIGWTADPAVSVSALAAPAVTQVARTIATLHDLGRQRDDALRRADIAGNAASVDVLTKLGNRRAFDAYLRAEEDRCVRHEHGGVVFVIDLDRLKEVNDTDGHAAGDRYLRAAAIALTEAMRPTDVVFRTGGDEFATIAVRSNLADAPGIEARMRTQLDAHGVDASIGWAARPPEATLLQAFAAADEAMYRQKIERRAEAGAGDDAATADPS